jgi:Flp pilus assembly protein TadG
MFRSKKNKRRSGIGLLCTMLILIAVCALATLGLDLGRVRLTRSQLRSTCESAALLAAQFVPGDPTAARQAAMDAANANFADGSRVVLQEDDVRFIRWDDRSRTYDVLSEQDAEGANAVLVTAYRTAERQNPVRLPFASLIGRSESDVSGNAIALSGSRQYGAVGLEFVTLRGNASITPAGQDRRGGIATNGDIRVVERASVSGDAHAGVERMIEGSERIRGTLSALTEALMIEQANVGISAKENGNARINWLLSDGAIVLGRHSKASIPAGTYYVTGMKLGAGSELNFTGRATMYVAGGIELGANSAIEAPRVNDLKLIVLGAGPIVLRENVTLHADLFAPQSQLEMNSGDLYGAVVAKSINLGGNAAIHYDLSTAGGVKLID